MLSFGERTHKMAAIIYSLCTITAFVCAWLLLRSYRKQKFRLLLWGGICFCGFFLNNALLVVDQLIFTNIDLSAWRLLTGLISLLFLLYGLIWEDEER